MQSERQRTAAQFERLVMPHLDAAYNLARWLAGNDHDAEDIAQEACVRAFRLSGLSRQRRARVAAGDRAEHALFVAEEKPRAAGGFH